MPDKTSDFIITKQKDRIEKKDMQTLRRYKGHDSTVVIPDGVEKIDSYVFADDIEPDSTIEKIIVPSSVRRISPLAFHYCNALKEIQFPMEMSDFEVHFEQCPSLQELWIPEHAERIGNLRSLDSLKEIHVGKNIKRINFTSFGEETPEMFAKRKRKLTETLLKSDAYEIVDGFMMNKIHRSVLYRSDCTQASMRIPDGARTISGGVFYELVWPENYERIRKVVIPSSVKEIRNLAFHCCESLQEVRYEGNSAELKCGEMAFFACSVFHRDGREIICKDTPETETNNSRITNLKIERLVIIHKQIKAGGYPNTNDLLDACKRRLDSSRLSLATISRDLAFMRDRLSAPIEYDFFRKGYYYTESDFKLDLEKLYS